MPYEGRDPSALGPKFGEVMDLQAFGVLQGDAFARSCRRGPPSMRSSAGKPDAVKPEVGLLGDQIVGVVIVQHAEFMAVGEVPR